MRIYVSSLCVLYMCPRTHCGVLQDDPVVDVSDELGGCWSLGALASQKVQDLGGKDTVLTVLDKLTEVVQS